MTVATEDIHFIHIPKTAGTSVKKALRAREIPENANEDTYADHLSRGGVICTTHSAPKELPAHPFFDQAFTFAVVRNPWDRMLSYWWYIKTISHTHDPQWVFDDFEEFCGKLAERRKDEAWGRGLNARQRLANQFEWLQDAGLDVMLRFESLSEGWDELRAKIGGDYPGLPVENRFHEQFNYKTMYSPTARDLVAEACRDDIEYLSYEF